MLFGLGMLLQDMGKPEKARLQLEEERQGERERLGVFYPSPAVTLY